jgi:hypothetical protein
LPSEGELCSMKSVNMHFMCTLLGMVIFLMLQTVNCIMRHASTVIVCYDQTLYFSVYNLPIISFLFQESTDVLNENDDHTRYVNYTVL